ncbi:sulfotransferase domain-containing protein [Actinocorallia sp. API 0066]|uniref:sulfotransferase domain-containing protein n=1 Tax=Actinocorallia sp. API 0066 TaxID=2896846 RepID=UPI001E63CF36|nr:sulfotransferase domain-containing protein [Actinocorallia sp. API 0066]MCD0450181.1 sulfotransferase domain-containing protein [Actinocorallia sp. API 0066]
MSRSPHGGLPDFVVIGAQKSASTFLQDQMALHPDVELAEGEVRAFEDPFYDAAAVAALPSLFQGSGRVRGIKRPDYLGRPEVAARLREHLPEARLLVVVREPVARAVSAYYHYVRHGFLPLLPLEDAFARLLDGSLDAEYPRAPEILSYGRYGHHLARYLEHFPAERIAVFEQKALTADPAAALRRAFTLVGVDPEFTPPPAPRVSNRGVYSPARLRLLRTKNRFMYEYTPELSLRRPRRPSPAGWLYNASVVGLDRLVLSRFDPGRAPAPTPELRARLEAFYADDRAALLAAAPSLRAEAAWL